MAPQLALLVLFALPLAGTGPVDARTRSTEPFTVQASASVRFHVDVPVGRIRGAVDEMGLLQRNMPGLVGIRKLEGNRFLYTTRSEVPLGRDLELSFIVERHTRGEVTEYRTPDEDDPNYMRCRVSITPNTEGGTVFEIRLMLRLRREHATDVHWLAPLAGESFVSERMNEDLRSMLAEFRDRSLAELRRSFGIAHG